MDPVSLAVLTAAATTVGLEALKGAAGEAGKDAWGAIKSLLGFKSDPEPGELARQVAEQLAGDPELAKKLTGLIRDYEQTSTTQQVEAKNVGVVAQHQTVYGNLFNINKVVNLHAGGSGG